MAKKNKADRNEIKDEKPDEKKEGNKILTMLIVFLIVVIWLFIFGALIKLDVGGFGSGVLRPILKDVPVINRILPGVSNTNTPKKNNYGYKSVEDAVVKIKELEQTIQDMSKIKSDSGQTIDDLKAEIKRLKVFEKNQKAFEKEKKEFDKNVVFADAAPDVTEYKKYYEQIDPANATEIYRQVVEQLQYSDAIKAKSDIYKNMEPKAAAKILETMTADVESVAKILLSMKPKESAAIMGQMDNVVAAKITKKMLDMDAEKLAQ